ncbi:Cullin-domain-containing protein [Piromyces finnis]|uniref:Cullin-domain-containing protein n=1 Tax=Piromyces finnis TaxID=1754191 RepID=A0A1Y1VHV1_9FUNG|nr:Cullin-domain-containing protein [Piromyces finnis]|eukprot:ORX56544.1 Cullin-domain-containing protein [Piromyces finnis]
MRFNSNRRVEEKNKSEEIWRKLEKAFYEIFNKNAGELSFEELYRYSYNLVLSKEGSKVYNGTCKIIENRLKEISEEEIKPSFPVYEPGNKFQSNTEIERDLDFLRIIKKTWDNHIMAISEIKSLLMYMDRVYVPRAKLLPIYEKSQHIFRDTIVLDENIKELVINIILKEIERERSGEMIDRSLIGNVINMMLALHEGNKETGESLYKSIFEDRYLKSSRDYYANLSEKFLDENDASEWLKKTEYHMEEEKNRTEQYLSTLSTREILNIVEEETIEKHINTIIEMENSGLRSLVKDDRYEDLKRMYTLFGKVKMGREELIKALCEYIKELGKEINETWAQGNSSNDPKNTTPNQPVANKTLETTESSENSKKEHSSKQSVNPKFWVVKYLELKEKLDNILKRGFEDDKNFQMKMNSVFQVIINENPKASESLSLFIDDNLKKGIKGKSEDEVEELLNKSIVLFRFISDKDVFERYYKQHLAKRLLYKKSLSEDAERIMISRLQMECGHQFTTKLEGMYKDISISSELSSDFKTLEKAKDKKLPELNISVLTKIYWPISGQITPNLPYPAEIQTLMDDFSKFYYSRHSGRKLLWQSSLGSADLRINYERGSKDINICNLGMILLINIFNKWKPGDSYTFRQMQIELEANDLELKRVLQSLVFSKYKLLLKLPKSRDIKDDDEFIVNTKFSTPLNRIKIPMVVASGNVHSRSSVIENNEERNETYRHIEDSRRFQIDAAVVRIMKGRKKMYHNNLITEVTNQLSSRFMPSPTSIKKRIESLIEREYMERSPDDRKIYLYLA